MRVSRSWIENAKTNGKMPGGGAGSSSSRASRDREKSDQDTRDEPQSGVRAAIVRHDRQARILSQVRPIRKITAACYVPAGLGFRAWPWGILEHARGHMPARRLFEIRFNLHPSKNPKCSFHSRFGCKSKHKGQSIMQSMHYRD